MRHMQRIVLVVLIVLIAGGLYAQSKPGAFIGVITDTMCGHDHAMMGTNTPPSKCAVDCVKSNPSRYKYALLVGKKIYTLSDQQTPEKFAGQKVKITGTLYEKTNVLEVKSIEAAK